jgi:hypothetical protein
VGISTNLNAAPWFDDYDPTKDYVKMLFQPGVSVQTRELNQLQTLLQKQIERFGDNIFKQGTIVSGCNFIFYPSYSYVKILDNEIDGTTSVVSKYFNTIATCDTSGLSAKIINYQDGFESSDPDLKTLYLQYINSGNDSNTEAFTAGDVLTCRDLNNSIWGIKINNGGSGFSNSDPVIFLPQLIVNVASGTYANGDSVITAFGSNTTIIGIDTLTYASKSQIILTVRPRVEDLASPTSTSNNWTVSVGDSITNQSNTVTARVEGVIGTGAIGRIVTDSVGKIIGGAIFQRGQQYTIPPNVTVKSANNTTGLNSLDLEAQNYVGQVRVASTSGAVGNGYAFAVTEGVIYQKGFFLRVAPQTIIVDKYAQTPNAVSCGFFTDEAVVDYNIDPSLRDPVNNTENQGAPGASRLQLIPELVIANTTDADANADFFTIVAWSEGNPYKQNQTTVYNKIDDELAKRTMEESGNYVVDSFLMSTRSPIDTTQEASKYSTVIDPGTAYISGKRVQTLTNFTIDTDKPLDTLVTNSHAVNLNYGNYIYINNLGGVFQYNTGDTINLYTTAKGFLSNTTLVATGNTTPQGTMIGTARIRSLVLASGSPGSQDALYRLHVFNIVMNSGKNFADVRSVYYNGTQSKGIADVVVSSDSTIIHEPNTSQLLFATGAESIKNANNISYIYRTLDQSLSVANTGLAVKSIASTPNEFYPYTGALTSAQMTELYVVPTSVDLIYNSNIAGTVSVNTTSSNLVGTATSFFSDLRAGDFVYVYANTTAYQIRRVTSIVNSTLAVLDGNVSFSNTTAGVARAFPANVPVPFGTRDGLSANVDINQNILTLNFGGTFASVTSANVAVGVNIRRTQVTEVSKSPNRIYYTKICCANNEGGTNGPWCLGVPDIFRVRGVYVGDSTVSNTNMNAISSFYVDHNQNPDFLDLGYLYKSPKAPVNITSSSYILVEYDYFTTSGVGVVDTLSYVSSNVAQRLIVDSQPLSNLTSTVNSFEIPEVFDNIGTEYDLLEYFDFRPVASVTAAPSSTPAGAPINPSSTLSFGNTQSQANELKFPLPGTPFVCDIEQFLGRTDSVILASDGNFHVLTGKPAVDPAKRYSPVIPQDSMKLTDLNVPTYPNLPIVRSTTLNTVLTTYVINGRFLKTRTDDKAITKPRSQAGSVFDVPKVYTMADIGHLDRRLTDVEYYVSLNQLESNVASLAIPSSVSPSLDRFKFGFFADDLSTYAFSDRDNPNYAAQIEDNAAVPEKLTWDVYFNGVTGGADYIDFQVVSQDNATWPDTLGPVCVLQYVTYNVRVINGQYYLNIPQQVNYVQDPPLIPIQAPTVPIMGWVSPETGLWYGGGPGNAGTGGPPTQADPWMYNPS